MSKSDASRKSGTPVLVVTTIGSFLMMLALSAVNVALPEMGTDLSMNAVSLGWVALAFTLSTGMFLVPLGKLADMLGRTAMFVFGIWIFTGASLFLAVSSHSWMVIAFRAVQGLGCAMFFVTVLAILVSAYPPEESGKVLGIHVASTYAGLTVGPFIGGLLTQNFGWRSVFFINVPIGLAVAVLSMWKFPPHRAKTSANGFDVTGSFIYIVTLFAALYGFSLIPHLTSIVFITVGVIGAVVFVWWETRTENPVLDLSLFTHNAVFTLSSTAALISYAAIFSMTFLLSFYLQYIKSLTPLKAGLVLVCQPAVMAILSPVAGRLSDKIEPRVLASVGMALIAACLFFLASLSYQTSLAAVIIDVSLLGAGIALFSSPNINAIMSSVGDRLHSVASSMVATARSLGQILSMGIAMLTFALFIGQAQITPPLYSALLRASRTAFIIFGILCGIGVFASLARGNVR
ncbi:MAG TPA: MFS transporter [Syntrophorhabdaceae bacterium]|nr:MFS transporter [Syntrophorhabdaceae bacterium]